jgi:hypothetical protein
MFIADDGDVVFVCEKDGAAWSMDKTLKKRRKPASVEMGQALVAADAGPSPQRQRLAQPSRKLILGEARAHFENIARH